MDIYNELRMHGAEIKNEKKTGILIVGFSSKILTDIQLNLLKNINDNCLLAFYGCDLTQCELSILVGSTISNVAIIYSKFSDAQLNEIIKIEKLKKIKIFDTQVSKSYVEKIMNTKPDLEINFN